MARKKNNKGTVVKPKMGRPLKYDSSMCEKVVELAWTRGLMRYEISRELGITYQTLLAWEKTYKDFTYALKESDVANEAWWMKQVRDNLIMDKDFKFLAAPFIFLMKNKFGWTDKREIDNNNRNETKFVIDIQNASIENLKKLKEMTPEQRKKTMKVVNG